MKRRVEGAPNSVQRSAPDRTKTALSRSHGMSAAAGAGGSPSNRLLTLGSIRTSKFALAFALSILRPFRCEDGKQSAMCRLPFTGYGVLSTLVYPSRVGLLKGAPVFGSIGPQEILIVLVIALVVLGPKKLPEMARSLGKGVKEFKEGINDDDTVDVTADEEEEEPVSSRVHELPPADLPPAAEAPEPVVAPEPAVTPAGADKPAADAS